MQKINVGQPRKIDDRKNIFWQCNEALSDIWQIFETITSKLSTAYADKDTCTMDLEKAVGKIPGFSGVPAHVISANSVETVISTSGTALITPVTIPAGFFNGLRSLRVELDCRGASSGYLNTQLQFSITAGGVTGIVDEITVLNDCHVTLDLTQSGTHCRVTARVSETGFTPVISRFITVSVPVANELLFSLNVLCGSLYPLTVYNVKVIALSNNS